MAEPAEKIIVFDSFDSVIKANIIKTKLDAYGIPCFLTGEHFVNLYPFKNELFPGVRLHIFEKDRERVKDILVEEIISENEIIRCPRCTSRNVLFEDTQENKFIRIITALSTGILFPVRQVYRCQDCHTEFAI